MVASNTYSKRRHFEISEEDVIRSIATYYIVIRKEKV